MTETSRFKRFYNYHKKVQKYFVLRIGCYHGTLLSGHLEFLDVDLGLVGVLDFPLVALRFVALGLGNPTSNVF